MYSVNHKYYGHLIFSFLLVGLIFLSSCSTTSTQLSKTSSTSDKSAKTPLELLRYYENQANRSNKEQQAYYQLLASEILINQQKYASAARKMRQIDRNSLPEKYQSRILVLEAALATLRGQYALALQKLPKMKTDFPEPVKQHILSTRATALAGAGYLSDSLLTYIELDKRVNQAEKRLQHHHAIWKILHTLPTTQRIDLASQNNDKHLLGWLNLVNELEDGRLSGYSREDIITSWKNKHPTHPALTFVDNIGQLVELPLNYPKHMALLLPLSDKRYSKKAKAILNGFLTAFYNTKTQYTRPSIDIIDISDTTTSLAQLLSDMQETGVEMIIGPLSKEHVDEAIQANPAIPILALNNSHKSLSHNNVFQFGLIPENEARQAAKLAILRGEKRAAILIPNTTLGERLRLAFSETYTALGGRILNETRYIAHAVDHKASIQQMFNIQQSHNRQSILTTVLGKRATFEPRHRQDIDAIFMVANDKQGRSLKPQLRFHNILDIPIYSTSKIYNGMQNSRANQDLNGVVFTETPWLLNPDTQTDFTAIQQLWPKSLTHNARLYALGIDAFNMIPHLKRLQASKLERFNGVSGSIKLAANNHLQRELIWSQFHKGIPKKLQFTALEKANSLEQSLLPMDHQ